MYSDLACLFLVFIVLISTKGIDRADILKKNSKIFWKVVVQIINFSKNVFVFYSRGFPVEFYNQVVSPSTIKGETKFGLNSMRH